MTNTTVSPQQGGQDAVLAAYEDCARIAEENKLRIVSDDTGRALVVFKAHNNAADDIATSIRARGASLAGEAVQEIQSSDGGKPEVERTRRGLAGSDDGLGAMQAIPRAPVKTGPSEAHPPGGEGGVREALEPFAAVARDYIDRSLDEDEHILIGRITRANDAGPPPRVSFADLRKLLAIYDALTASPGAEGHGDLDQRTALETEKSGGDGE